MKTINMNTIAEKITSRKQTSAWDRGVTRYAIEIIEELSENGAEIALEDITRKTFIGNMLTKSFDIWVGYSRGGCSLIFDQEIAERLCTPSELKRTENGMRNPNRRETWLDVQGRALFQAANLIKQAIREEIA